MHMSMYVCGHARVCVCVRAHRFVYMPGPSMMRLGTRATEVCTVTSRSINQYTVNRSTYPSIHPYLHLQLWLYLHL